MDTYFFIQKNELKGKYLGLLYLTEPGRSCQQGKLLFCLNHYHHNPAKGMLDTVQNNSEKSRTCCKEGKSIRR